MSEAIANLCNSHDDESFIMARLLDFNGNLHDENTTVEMIVDGLVRTRTTLTNRVLELADKLDATIAEHAVEKAEYERQAAEKLEELQRKLNLYGQTLDALVKESNTKTAQSWRIKQSLQSIDHRK